MTELFIDNVPVVLPEDLKFDLKKENPYFSKNGTFSYDIDISLENAQNVKLYKHLNRINSSNKKLDRHAILRCDGQTILNGTEVIISNTDKIVSIQIVSGNSELNWFISEEKYISDINLGETPYKDIVYDNNELEKVYPSFDFAPARVKIGDTIFNDYTYELYEGGTPPPYGESYLIFKNKRMQPYLMTLIERLLTAFGYKIIQNDLTQYDILSRLFVLNHVEGWQFNKMLPGWKVSEFFEAVEKFLNIIFLIDNKDKTVQVICRSDFYTTESSGTTVINNILNEYTRTTSKEEESSDNGDYISYKNIGYKLGNDTEYKYYDIDDETLNKCEIQDFDNFRHLTDFLSIEYKGMPGKPKSGFIPDNIATQYYNKFIVFHIKNNDTYYIVEKGHQDADDNFTELNWYFLRRVNILQKKITDKSDKNITELEITPAIMHKYLSGFSGPKETWVKPSSIDILYEDYIPYQSFSIDEEYSDIHELIENGVKDFNAQKKDIVVALYGGVKSFGSKYDRFIIYSDIDFYKMNSLCVEDKNMPFTLSLSAPSGLVEKYYHNGKSIDISTEYTFKFIYPGDINVCDIFFINNRKFYCKDLQYTVTNKGLEKIVIGTFIPANE